jgi:hypothetical protein
VGASYSIEGPSKDLALDRAREFQSKVYRRFRRNCSILAVVDKGGYWAAIVDVCGYKSVAVDETAREVSRD